MLYITQAKSADLEEIMAFYEAESRMGFSPPSRATCEKVIEKGIFMLIKHENENGPILAGSLAVKRDRLNEESPENYPDQIIVFGAALRAESTKADPQLKNIKFQALMNAVRFAELIARGDMTVELVQDTDQSTPFRKAINARMSGPKLALSAFPGVYNKSDNKRQHDNMRRMGYVPIRIENEDGTEWSSDRMKEFMERTGIKTATEYMMSPHGLRDALELLITSTTDNPPIAQLDPQLKSAQPAGRAKLLSAYHNLHKELANAPKITLRDPKP